MAYFGKGMDTRIRRRVSRSLSIPVGTMLFKYLGVFVGCKKVPLSYFNEFTLKV